ncbi:MAG: alpha/beta fold hydrolase [Hyphomicrobiaceae bacterium]
MENLVLVPGLLCTEDLFAAQIEGLGQTAAISVADHSSHDSIGAIAASILAAAPPRFALAGLSMGGYVAFEILRQAGDRVVRLALLDTSARPDTPEQTANRRRLVAIAQKKGIDVPAREMFPRLVAPARSDDGALQTAFLSMAADTGAEAFARQQSAIAGRPDSRQMLTAISCPTLVLVGSEDQLTPPDLASEMADAIPGATLKLIAGAGHLSTLEEPAAVTAALLAWLSQ